MSSVTRSRAYPKVAHGTGQLIYKTLATVKRLTLLRPHLAVGRIDLVDITRHRNSGPQKPRQNLTSLIAQAYD